MKTFGQSFLPGRFSRIAGLILFAAFAAVSLSAATLDGTFGTVGAGVLTFQNGTAHFIDFCPTDPTSPATNPSCAGAANYGKGDITVTLGSGFYAGTAGTAATILDLVDQAGHPPFTYFPVGVSTTVNNFLALSARPTLNFIGTIFEAQSCVPSATQICIGGFQLSQVNNNVSVSATVDGRVVDSATGMVGFWTDILTAQFTNTTVAAVAAGATSANGVFSNSWSNSVAVTSVPEPATYGMLGGALLLLGSLARRFRRR